MNRKIILSATVMFVMIFTSCSSLTECNSKSNSEGIILLDVSDTKLFQLIRQDLNDNFGSFMLRSRLGIIEPCQRFTLRLAPIAAQEELEISSQSIEISRKGQSIREQEQQADPSPLVSMLKVKLDEYEKLSNSKEATSGSVIINKALKAILQTDPEAESTIILLTDGIEYNEYLSMYKKIPKAEEIPEIIKKLIDPEILSKFKSAQEQGVNPKIIIVLKPCSPPAKVNIRAVKAYWAELLKELKLTNVQFADNLATISQ